MQGKITITYGKDEPVHLTIQCAHCGVEYDYVVGDEDETGLDYFRFPPETPAPQVEPEPDSPS